jgi:hypothetical protein
MIKVIEYKIVHEYFLPYLVKGLPEIVTEMVADGWELLGGAGFNKSIHRFYQTFVRYEPTNN